MILELIFQGINFSLSLEQLEPRILQVILKPGVLLLKILLILVSLSVIPFLNLNLSLQRLVFIDQVKQFDSQILCLLLLTIILHLDLPVVFLDSNIVNLHVLSIILGFD